MSSQYLSNNNLHYKPICAHLGRVALWSSTSIANRASTTQWHGRVVALLSRAALILGACLAMPIAVIETVAFGILAGLGHLIHRLIFQNRSEFLQKWTLRSASHTLHSAIVSIGLLGLAARSPVSKSHTLNAAIDNGIHLGSAAFIQSTWGALLDRNAGRNRDLFAQRTLNLLADSHPGLLNDFVVQIQRDFDVNMRDRVGQLPNMATYLRGHPEDRDFIHAFNFYNFANDREYRQRSLAVLGRYLEIAQVIRPRAEEAAGLRFELNQNTQAEKDYQDYLAHTLRDAFIEIHQNDELNGFLDKGDDKGKDLLEMIDASTYVPLTAYTQYKELLAPIACPEQFTGNLARYASRHADLLAAKEKVDALTDEESERLVEKILRGSDFQAEGSVQEAYMAISALATPLYQGPLMTKTSIDFGSQDPANMISTTNLFQKSIQEALAIVNQA